MTPGRSTRSPLGGGRRAGADRAAPRAIAISSRSLCVSAIQDGWGTSPVRARTSPADGP
jgi:hypothetical protein